jgi:hypothetical protein
MCGRVGRFRHRRQPLILAEMRGACGRDCDRARDDDRGRYRRALRVRPYEAEVIGVDASANLIIASVLCSARSFISILSDSGRQKARALET